MKVGKGSSKLGAAVEKEILETELGPVIIKRRKGRRRLSIVLHPRRPIEVRSNLKMSHQQIKIFLLEKKDWIEKNQNKFQNQKEKFPEKKFEDGEAFPLLGKTRSLKMVQGLNKKVSVRFDGNFIILAIPVLPVEDSKIVQSFRDLYKKVSVAYLQQRVQALSARMNCQPTELSFGEAKSLWGSCHQSGHVRLNWKLIVFEPEIIDYVVIHELAHLKFLNHSARFWNWVEQFEPDFQNIRRKLKESEALVAFLERPKL